MLKLLVNIVSSLPAMAAAKAKPMAKVRSFASSMMVVLVWEQLNTWPHRLYTVMADTPEVESRRRHVAMMTATSTGGRTTGVRYEYGDTWMFFIYFAHSQVQYAY